MSVKTTFLIEKKFEIRILQIQDIGHVKAAFSGISTLPRLLNLTPKRIMVPVSFELHALFVYQNASAISDTFKIEAREDGAIWLESPAVAGGVTILESTGLNALFGEQGRVVGAELADNRVVDADVVLVGIGILPTQSLAESAGLAVDNGILVDAHCRTSNADIFAAGDCTRFEFDGRHIRLESVPHAIHQAEIAAQNMMDEPTEYRATPWFWSDQYDVKLQIAGLNTGYDRVVARKVGAARSFWYFAGDQLLAVDAINAPRDYMVGKRLIEAGKSPAPEVLADPETDMKALLKP